MCGSVRLSSDISEIKLVFSIPPHRPSPNIAPSWNVAPTDPLPVVHYDAKAGERSLDVMRWGLVPFWAKDIKVGFSNINAKAEGIEGKPAFREAFQRRRCLVPVDNVCSATPFRQRSWLPRSTRYRAGGSSSA
jgi:putative SOS response-associated peptidase YedK